MDTPKRNEPKKVYHGWIYRQQEKGFNDSFSVQWKTPVGSETASMGYAAQGAAAAVDHFEIKLGLKSIKLEDTPLGYRVFTLEEVENGHA